jgi:trans-aconitate 2-methyltransferase
VTSRPAPDLSAPRTARFENWDAGRYHELSTPHAAWGSNVLGHLRLRGDETVLDLGCGTGRLAAMVLRRFPRAWVIAVDASLAMAKRARAELGERAGVICCDLLDLALGRPAGAAVSSATFHWIADHERLFLRVRDAVAPGASFVAQCGGAGNIAALMSLLDTVNAEAPFRSYLAGWAGPWHYATADATRTRLERSGFEVARCWLEQRPVRHDRPREFLGTVVLAPYLERLPAELHPAYLDRVLQAMPDPPVLDFVRLNFVARCRERAR